MICDTEIGEVIMSCMVKKDKETNLLNLILQSIEFI